MKYCAADRRVRPSAHRRGVHRPAGNADHHYYNKMNTSVEETRLWDQDTLS